MCRQARKLGIYKNYIHAAVDKLGSVPVNDETYDVILMANGFAPGNIGDHWEYRMQIIAYRALKI